MIFMIELSFPNKEWKNSRGYMHMLFYFILSLGIQKLCSNPIVKIISFELKVEMGLKYYY